MIAAKPLIVTLFGSTEIRIAGQPISRLRTRKGYWLFGLLTLQHGREVRRDWLAGVLWPESLESQARANLNLCVTDLRKALGAEACRLKSVTTSTLCLDLAGADCDLIDFDRLSGGKDRADLERAIARYCGPLLADCIEPWVTSAREQREQAYLQALERLAEEAATRRDWRLNVHYLRLIVKHDPYRDNSQLQLMHALAAGGDLNAALQVYQDFVRFLRANDMQARPGHDLEQFWKQLRSRVRRQIDPVGRSGFTLPPQSAVSTVPARIASLIGREQEVVQVTTVLRRSRLVTLTGTGGIGKTSLATVVAEETAGEYPCGAAFVALDRLTAPDEIPLHLLSALGALPDARRTPAETLMRFLADRAMLIVLDNMEHLLPAGAKLAEEILRRCPQAAILMTSRQPLGIPGEVVWRVPPLSVPDPHWLHSDNDLFAAACRSHAVRLFAERAAANRADFELTPLNVRAVIEICSRLDGNPFAIELAAARVVALPVADIARRLQSDYRILTGVNPIALPRHQTLTALIDWSFNLLDRAEQTLLLRLSVFQSGFSLDVVESICADPPLETAQILNLLTSLVNRSLVAYDEYGSTPGYRLEETIRQYAAERLLLSGEQAPGSARPAAYAVARAKAQSLPHLTYLNKTMSSRFIAIRDEHGDNRGDSAATGRRSYR